MVFFENGDLIGSTTRMRNKKTDTSKNCPDWIQKWKKQERKSKRNILYFGSWKKKTEKERDWKKLIEEWLEKVSTN